MTDTVLLWIFLIFSVSFFFLIFVFVYDNDKETCNDRASNAPL